MNVSFELTPELVKKCLNDTLIRNRKFMKDDTISIYEKAIQTPLSDADLRFFATHSFALSSCIDEFCRVLAFTVFK